VETNPRDSGWLGRLGAFFAPSGWRLAIYIATVVALPVLLGAFDLAGRTSAPSAQDLLLLILLGASALGLERSRTNLFGDSEVSLNFVPVFATAVMFGPAEAAAVGGGSMYISLRLFDRGEAHKVLLSAGAVALAALAGSAAFHFVAGEASANHVLAQLLPALGSGLLVFVVNSVVVAGAIAISVQRNPIEIWHEKFRWLAPHYLAFSASSYAMAMSYLALGTVGVAIFALPAAVLWFGVRQYSDRARADVLRLQEQSEVLSRSEERFRSLVEHAPGIVAVISEDGTMQSLILERSGRTFRRDQRTELDAMVHPSDISRFTAVLADMSADPDYTVEIELRMRDHPEGEWREYVAVLKNLSATPAVGGIVVTAHDVTEQKGLELQLRHQAFHDPLTQLPNRALFTDRLEHALASMNSRGGRVAVMYVDLDRFKTVNDTFGHHVGDDLLVTVAKRLTPTVRAGDTFARFGGDEFTVVLDGVEDESEVEEIAARIQERVAEPIEIGGNRILVTASIGVAITEPGVTISARDLTRNADVALFHAKEEGRARTELFSDKLDPYTVERYQLERDLREAVENGELVLFYQPEVNMVTRQVIGFEALVRWQHPTRGLVPPDEFIPLAEENGAIADIGRWVLDEACRQAAIWQEQLFEGRHFTMGVNLSASEFFESDLVERVRNVLETTGLNPASLRIEITESVLLGDTSVADNVFHDLKALGVELAIDDFGTGYSSFGYLRRLPADILKVDRSFISSIDRDEREISIVRAVVAVADALGMGVTVEGIEREEQAAIMMEMGAHHAQGYLFSAPCDAAAAEAFAREMAGQREAA